MILCVEPVSSELGKPCCWIFEKFFIEKPMRLSNRQPTDLSKKRKAAERSEDPEEEQALRDQHGEVSSFDDEQSVSPDHSPRLRPKIFLLTTPSSFWYRTSRFSSTVLRLKMPLSRY